MKREGIRVRGKMISSSGRKGVKQTKQSVIMGAMSFDVPASSRLPTYRAYPILPTTGQQSIINVNKKPASCCAVVMLWVEM